MSWILFLQFFLLFIFHIAASQSIIKTLPGYQGALPFRLETGYIFVGENKEVQLFYYFIESERDPRNDPLVLWLTGGPGCSGLSALVYEIGPVTFDVSSFSGSLPSFVINEYSWTKVANIIFLDQPVGTGFSYATTLEGYSSSDTKAAKDVYMFMRKWLLNHPMFAEHRFYVAGDSYAGKTVPMVAWNVHEGNEAGLVPRISLKGYFIGNPVTDFQKDKNERIPFAHRLALISDEYFELAKNSCEGEYFHSDPTNTQCLSAVGIFEECTKNVKISHVLEPDCEDKSVRLSLPTEQKEEQWCRKRNYLTSYVWANDPSAQKALYTRQVCKTSLMIKLCLTPNILVVMFVSANQGTIGEWRRCNHSVSYKENVASVFQYHQLLNQKGYRALVYSGDHDMTIPYLSTLKWIHALNLTVEENWRPWYVNGQVAGYTEKYKNNGLDLIFATVKGGGHTAPEYKPKECFAMIDRWLSQHPL